MNSISDKAAYEKGYADGKMEAELIIHKKIRKLITKTNHERKTNRYENKRQ